MRLQRATNDFHKEHADSNFCKTTIRYMEEIASILGPDEVIFMSQDDKVSYKPFFLNVNLTHSISKNVSTYRTFLFKLVFF